VPSLPEVTKCILAVGLLIILAYGLVTDKVTVDVIGPIAGGAIGYWFGERKADKVIKAFLKKVEANG